ncbi:hypothetical protein F4802DRAFT_448038 [Xylaria palmicola]|nr:hypothetical protein F4802DRAFT_448038 [Xylaria palmicola]
MPHSHSSSTVSRSSTESSGKSNNGNGPNVLSRVIGSLRRSPRSDDTIADGTEDADWVSTYKITHHPDRPRRDRREDLSRRNSADVLGQLLKIWKHNEQVTEAKRRERESRQRAAAGSSRSRAHDNDADRRGRGDGGPPSAPAKSEWEADSEAYRRQHGPDKSFAARQAQHGRSASSPSSLSVASDKMTIMVGLEVPTPYGEEKPSGFRTITRGAGEEAGGYSNERDDAAGQQTSSSALPAPKGGAQRRHPQLKHAGPTIRKQQQQQQEQQASRTRTHANKDSTPSLTAGPSPLSLEPASPATPIVYAPDNERVVHRDPAPTTGSWRRSRCPMPSCGKLLRTGADLKQNLCGECRSDLQPRHSIFAMDLINPFLIPYPSDEAPVPDRRTPEVKHTETARGVDDEDKAGTAGRTRGQEISSPPSSSKKRRGGGGGVSSPSNRDRGEFRLQPVPASRKRSGRGRGQQPGNPDAIRKALDPGPASPSRDEDDDAGDGDIHIQLGGWALAAPSPTPQPLSQKRASGPLLEPKTYRPTTPRAGQTKKKESPVAVRRPSDRRVRTRGGSPLSNGGRALPSLRTRIEKPSVRRVNHQPGTSVTGRPAVSHTDGRGSDKQSKQAAATHGDIYCEIDNIIDCYLGRPDAPESENEKRKAEAVASYFATVPLDVEMSIKNFI